MHWTRHVYRRSLKTFQTTLARLGLNVARSRDYYSPLPVRSEIEARVDRWARPSALVGVDHDLEAMRELLRQLVGSFVTELDDLPSFSEAKGKGYGPGFTLVDAVVVYCMTRHLKPAHYIEIGSGLSSFYAWTAAQRNEREGTPCRMCCIDPFSRNRVSQLRGVEILRRPMQDVEPEFFDVLGERDVLFIDSTHVVKLDGEVPYLYLEIVPRLNPGVVIHAHDIHFPYNVPYPWEQTVLAAKWPRYSTEAMLLQAFLAFNREFTILLSAPLLRFFDEAAIAELIPGYRPVEVEDWDTHYGSLWIQRRIQRPVVHHSAAQPTSA